MYLNLYELSFVVSYVDTSFFINDVELSSIIYTNTLSNDVIKDINTRLSKSEFCVLQISTLEDKDVEKINKVVKKHDYKLIAFINNDVSLKKKLLKAGFDDVFTIDEKVKINKIKLSCDLKDVKGNFDIIGDIHGCYDELIDLLIKAGYTFKDGELEPLNDRKLIFLGDLVDRGNKIKEVLELVMKLVNKKVAYCIMGNHDDKLLRYLKGNNVKIIHGLESSVEQLSNESKEFIDSVIDFLSELPVQYVFDEGRLVVAHAGLKEDYHGKESKRIRKFALYGDITGETDEEGFPIRRDWALNYKGKALVVYGHTPYLEIRSYNNTINIDTGCVFGNKLTMLRYPELEIIDVDANKVYYEHKRKLV